MQQNINNPWYSLFLLLIITMTSTFVIQIGLMLITSVFSTSDFMSTGESGFNLAGIHEKWIQYVLLAGASISTFLLPAIYLQRIEREQFKYFPANKNSYIIYLLVLTFMFAFSPLMSLIGDWNLNMQLPDSMRNIETWMKQKEAEMAVLTENLVMVTSWSKLFANLLVMAVIPAVVEEFFFRGALQNITQRIVKNPHLAIVITSIIFSAIHVQFYGFFPRMILGIFFGYFLLWSGNIWLAVFAHFVNNATVTCIAFYYARQGKTYEQLMSNESFSIFAYIASLIASVVLAYLLFNLLKRKRKLHGKKLDENQNIFE